MYYGAGINFLLTDGDGVYESVAFFAYTEEENQYNFWRGY
jgi:hypothetical protein